MAEAELFPAHGQGVARLCLDSSSGSVGGEFLNTVPRSCRRNVKSPRAWEGSKEGKGGVKMTFNEPWEIDVLGHKRGWSRGSRSLVRVLVWPC